MNTSALVYVEDIKILDDNTNIIKKNTKLY